MIVVENIKKTFGNRVAVKEVSFTVEEGNVLVLLGTSGSGKTTTLRMINRLIEPTAGTITVDGKDVRTQAPEVLRRNMGYVLQGYGLFPHFTVAENIALVPNLLKWPREKTATRVDHLLQKLHLPPAQYRHLYPNQLSGGQKQRVGLARALAAEPPILLMDEPFGALDPLTRSAIRQEFSSLDEWKKKTIILVTHDIQEAFALADKIALMDSGRLQQIGTPAELLFNPQNAFVKEFFQHQRLQLEWQTLKLKDIWPDLPMYEASTAPHLDSSETIWNAMTYLMETPHPLGATEGASNTTRLVTLATLQAALQKRRSHHG